MLATAPCARSAHFVVHYLDAQPSPPAARVRKALPQAELSTGDAPGCSLPVDEIFVPAPRVAVPLPDRDARPAWLGMVVPKRHARRAVTRSLLKRQVRAAVDRVAGEPQAAAAAASPSPVEPPLPAVRGLSGGLWIVRLRAPFERQAFPSATSQALRGVVRAELDRLLAAALLRCAGGGSGGAARPASRRAGAAAGSSSSSSGSVGERRRPCTTGRAAA